MEEKKIHIKISEQKSTSDLNNKDINSNFIIPTNDQNQQNPHDQPNDNTQTVKPQYSMHNEDSLIHRDPEELHHLKTIVSAFFNYQVLL